MTRSQGSITEEKNLRTGAPVWMRQRMPVVAHNPLTKNIRTDVAIIGAGITGAMCAEELTAAGLEVVLLDKRGPLKGSTSASTALLLYEIDTPLLHLSRKLGFTKAARAWQRSRLALQSLADCIDSIGISAECSERESIYLAGNVLNADQLREEQEIRRRAGLPCDYLSRSALVDQFGINRHAALLTRGAIEADPRKLAAGFLNAAIGRGATVYAPVDITKVKPQRGGVVLESSEGVRIQAKHVVYATGYEIPKAVATKRHQIHSTYAIATKPQPSKLWPGRAFIWEASDPYLYLRTTEDGRVICGGEDEDFENEEKRDALLPQKTAALERKLKKLFPQLDTEADYAWTGAFGGSTTGLPTIGPIPNLPHCFVVMAYGGNGITFSRLAAEVIRGYIVGEPDVDADLFRVIR